MKFVVIFGEILNIFLSFLLLIHRSGGSLRWYSPVAVLALQEAFHWSKPLEFSSILSAFSSIEVIFILSSGFSSVWVQLSPRCDPALTTIHLLPQSSSCGDLPPLQRPPILTAIVHQRSPIPKCWLSCIACGAAKLVWDQWTIRNSRSVRHRVTLKSHAWLLQ